MAVLSLLRIAATSEEGLEPELFWSRIIQK